MKKILILGIAFFTLALIPQSLVAQTNTKPSTQKTVVPKVKGDVVPIDQAGSTKPVMTKHDKATLQKKEAKVMKKDAKVMKKSEAPKTTQKEKVQLIVRPLKGTDKKAKPLNKKKAEQQ